MDEKTDAVKGKIAYPQSLVNMFYTQKSGHLYPSYVYLVLRL